MKPLYLFFHFIINNFQHIHAGSVEEKITSLFKLSMFSALLITPIIDLTGWYEVNYKIIYFVFIAVILDHIIGSYCHAFLKKDWSTKKNIVGFLTKTLITIVGFVIFEMLHYIVKDVDFISIYFKVTIHLMIFLYPAGSALMNLSIITEGKFPPMGLMNKLTRFNNNLDLNEFKTKKDEEFSIPNDSDS